MSRMYILQRGKFINIILLVVFGAVDKQLAPAWWSISRFMWLNGSWCVWYSEEEFSIGFLSSFMFLYSDQVLPNIFLLKWFYSGRAFLN